LLRREDLCDGPRLCPHAPDETTPCTDCLLSRLDDALESDPGWLLRRALDLDFALRARVTFTASDVAFDEFLTLRTLSEERDRHALEMNRRCPPRTHFSS
jgi:hypothetical protein